MKLKTIIVGGMLLGLLTGIGVAQRRTTSLGNTQAGARMPSAVQPGQSPGVFHPTPSVTTPNAPKTTTQPNATTTPNSRRVSPNTESLPDRATQPDAAGQGNRTVTGPGPTQ